MKEFLDQIRETLKNSLYYPALFISITIPSICGALESKDGRDSSSRYINWFNKYLGPEYLPNFSGDDCYAYRCAILHQGKSVHNNLNYDRVLFIKPRTIGATLHRCISGTSSSLAYIIDIDLFCEDMIEGCEHWYSIVRDDKTFKENYDLFMKPHWGGILPYIGGDVFVVG